MFFPKIITSDVFLLVLLVVRLRLDSDINQNDRWNRIPESHEVFLGSSSAYTQITFHSPYSNNRYPHPKSLELNELDEASILFNRLNYFNIVRERRSNLIAYYASSSDSRNSGPSLESSNSENTGSDATTPRDPSLPTGTEGTHNSVNGSSCEREVSTVPETPDLSPEDMDLIEILWKQDIDLGVTRDAYDSRQSLEAEKLKDIEYPKESLQDYFAQGDIKGCEENANIPDDPLTGLNYTIDSETGEYVLDGLPSLNEGEISSEHLLENETLSALNQDSYLPFDESAQFSNLTEAFSPSEFPQLLTDNFTSESFILSQIEDLEKELEKFDSLVETDAGNSTAGDMFPSMEECFSDTALLPLLTLGSNHQASFPSVSPRPIHGYQNLGTSNAIPHSSSLQIRSNENFSDVLPNTPLELPTADETFQSLSSAIGPSSIGCAVAQSMATLTNDTDPMPTCSILNTPYTSELPELLYANQTVTNPHNELLIPDLLLGDDFQMVALQSDVNHNMPSEDHIDTSSDSISLTSGRVPSLSDCPDWGDSCSESSSPRGELEEMSRNSTYAHQPEVSSSFNQHQNYELFHSMPQKRHKHNENRNENGNRNFNGASYQHDNGQNQQYFSLKNNFPDISNSANAVGGSNVADTRKFDFSIPRANGASCSNFLQHNHSYHLPFSNNDSRYKPVVRDKSRSSSEEESCNKDEKRHKELKIPISIDDIINLAIDEYNERLTKYELTEAQIILIRDIRRRGKNKVAAQNCRKRKMDQISNLQQDLDILHNEKLQLKSKQNHLLQQKRYMEDKYAQLYQLVLQSTNCDLSRVFHPSPPEELSYLGNNVTLPTTPDVQMSDDDSDLSRGARTKRKMKK